MKKITENDIQSFLDNDLEVELAINDSDLEELKSYQQLFEILNQGESINLNKNFALKTITKIESEQEKRFNLFYNGLLVILLIFAFLLVANLIAKDFIYQFYQTLLDYKAIVFWSIFGYFCIQYFDKKIVDNLK